MDKNDIIEHKAIIKSTTGGTYDAEILSMAGCASCQLKNVCSASDVVEKTIKVEKQTGKKLAIGDEVTVFISQSKGLWAVFFGYVLPFLIVFGTLILLYTITGNDGIAGGVSLFMLIPYYLVLYLLKNKINKKYKFYIK